VSVQATNGNDRRDRRGDLAGEVALQSAWERIPLSRSLTGTGLDGMWRMYQWLDRASQGQSETRPPTPPPLVPPPRLVRQPMTGDHEPPHRY
jgi:hypothetical protein